MADPRQYAAVRRVLLGVLLANLLVTAVKISLGVITGALAVVADGFHSLVDSSSNLVGLAALRLANRPADARHPYGYQRYETLGTLAIGGLLLAAAYEIGSSIIGRFFGGAQPEITPLTFALVALTFPVNLLIVWLETRLGKQLNSELLLADATHTRTDLFVTLSVLASLVGVWLGVGWLDLLVATGVVLLILRAAFGILRDSSAWLTDSTMLDAERIEQTAVAVPGVWFVHRVRSRGIPGAIFVDLHVKVYPGMSTEQAHALASEVERRIKTAFTGVMEVLVHIEPARPEHLGDFDRLPKAQRDWQRIAYDLRQIADSMQVSLHDLHVNLLPSGDYDLELHLEIPGDLPLSQAHALAEEFESRVRQVWTQVTSIITHLEPLPEAVQLPEQARNQDYNQILSEYLAAWFGSGRVLEVHTHAAPPHFSAAVRIGLPPDLTLSAAHTQAEAIERDLLSRYHALERVTVHVEPQDLS